MASVKQLQGKARSSWAEKGPYDKFLVVSSVIFLAVAGFLTLSHGDFFTPDQFFIIAFVVALLLGQLKSFIKDWIPALLLIFSYEYLRGLIPQINQHVHFYLMPAFDQFVFRYLPGTFLQQHLFNPNHLHWYDYTAVVLYLMHFIVPMLVAFVFWLTDKSFFREYVIAILALCYLTFLTYLVFPAAPPWMASQQGLIPYTQHLTGIIASHFSSSLSLPTVYEYFGINLTAAVPSLHAAFPLMSAIYMFRKFRKLWPVLAAYVLGVWFAVLYLGEHYFFDVVLGILYVLLVYALLQKGKEFIEERRKGKAAVMALE